MGMVTRCPECGKLIALSFPLHDCKPTEENMAKQKPEKTATQTGPRYFAIHEAGLRNGSFFRVRKPGHCAQFINGDFMGNIEHLPETYSGLPLTEFPRDVAEKLIPRCCR